MAKIKNLTEAILNIDKSTENIYGNPTTNKAVYSNWDNGHSGTIGDFYSDFIAPRLPDPDVICKWNELLKKYFQRDGAIIPIRGGYSYKKDKSKQKLRRGWLVRVDDNIDYDNKFSYTFTDNYLPAYIYKMALDGFCPTDDEFYKFMTEFVGEDKIEWLAEINRNSKSRKHIRNVNDPTTNKERCFFRMPITFGRVSRSETIKNAGINTTPAPTCPLGEYGYKHAHILDVRGVYKLADGDAREWKNIKHLVELGEESDYIWDDTINNYVWYRTMKNGHERDELRKAIVAHAMRFLSPINHFLVPKSSYNRYTKENGELAYDIAEYKILLEHMVFAREKEFGKDFTVFENAALYAENIKAIDNRAKTIDISYYQKMNFSKKDPSLSTGTSTKATTRRSGYSLEWKDFAEYSPRGYYKLVMDIMYELAMAEIHELETRIDEAIDFCTNEMDMAKKCGDKKRSKYYSNHRSALNKYKNFKNL